MTNNIVPISEELLTMKKPVISIKSLSKSFGALIASDDITIDLFEGEIHALIGPNGAGKSTLIKQIAGDLQQDTGEIYFNDEIPMQSRLKTLRFKTQIQSCKYRRNR